MCWYLKFFAHLITIIACVDPGCKTCSGADAGQCLECKENYFMQGGVCVACPPGQTSATGSVGAATCFSK